MIKDIFTQTTRHEQPNKNVLLTGQGFCFLNWLPSFHAEYCMHLCKLSSPIHLFVAHFVTCHRLLTSQRFSSHQLSLLVSFFPVSKHISQCLAWSSHFSQSPFPIVPVPWTTLLLYSLPHKCWNSLASREAKQICSPIFSLSCLVNKPSLSLLQTSVSQHFDLCT